MRMQLVIAKFSTLALLALGAAGCTLTAPISSNADLSPANVTVIQKNRDFPLKARMTVAPCAVAACVEI